MSIKTAINLLRILSGRNLVYPFYLIFFVTSKCMGKCRHCFYWERINQKEAPLTVEEVDKVASSMGRIFQLTFTGGEPFLREDLSELIERFYVHNKVYHLGVATSGYHPDRVEEVTKRILKTCPRSNFTVGLPIEGPADLNDEIRGLKGAYERTIETLSRLKRIKDHAPKLTILIDITISGFNAGRLIETYEHVRTDLSPDVVNVILTRGLPREQEAKRIDPGEVLQLLSLMEADIRGGRIRGYGFLSKLLHAKDITLRRMALDIYRGNTYHLPCQAGRVAGVLMPEGDIYPCELWSAAIGNIRETEYSLPAVWSSEKAVKTRREILLSRCTCYHQCFLSTTMFWGLRSWVAILREMARFRSLPKPDRKF